MPGSAFSLWHQIANALSTATSKTKSAGADGVNGKKMSRHTTFNSSLKTSSSGEHNRSHSWLTRTNGPSDRISYLGGILLPLPIVASILSMGDTFAPTDLCSTSSGQ